MHEPLRLGAVLVTELEIEARSTSTMLERIPPDMWLWRPHTRSRTVGELAAHISGLPALFLANLSADELDRASYLPTPDSPTAAVEVFAENVEAARTTLGELSNDALFKQWRYRYGERVIFEMPRYVVARTTGINHLVHHRGQLSVYLRLLDVPLPPIYGPTADE